MQQSVSDIIAKIGRADIVREVPAPESSVSRAIKDNLMPAHWYPSVASLGDKKGIAVPMNLFRWSDKRRSPSGAASQRQYGKPDLLAAVVEPSAFTATTPTTGDAHDPR